MNHSFKPGKVWLDTNGKPIQAHGFTVFYNEKDGLYYWYGENKEKTKGGLFNKVWHWGVRCYTSSDLYNWEDRGLIIPPQPDDLTSPLHPTYRMGRPHIIYCEKTGKYVAWMKVAVEGTDQFITVMQADDFMGPYEFVHKIYKPLEMDTADFDLVVDEQTKQAYFVFDRPHFEIVTALLDDTYTEVTGEYSSHYTELTPPFSRAAPAHFQRGNKHYLFTSGNGGYFPTPSRVCMFEDWHGEYEELGDPCLFDLTGVTFNSQIACVLKVPGKELYIAMADRWKPSVLAKLFAPNYYRSISKSMAQQRYVTLLAPDYGPKANNVLPGKLQTHGVNTSIARYVWLPIQWEDNKPVIRWYKEWRWEDFD